MLAVRGGHVFDLDRGEEMSWISRRSCLLLGASGIATAALATVAGRAGAAMGPNDKFDLVIKGGEVLDPSGSLRAKRDIGIRHGLIEAVEADIPVAPVPSGRSTPQTASWCPGS